MPQLHFINPLVFFIVLTLPSLGCLRDQKCAFVSQSSSAESVIPEGFGVNIDFTDPKPGEMAMVAEAGFRWVRMDLKWDETEKELGRYDFSAYDRLLIALQPHHIRALFILDYGNPLYENGAPPRTEASRQAFARWAVAAATHFAGRGAIWEVYNEPNHSMFWPPQPKPQEYVELALAVGRAFRASVPDEKLIGPATSEIDFSFLESCFKAGLLEYWSAVSIHPYRRDDPETATLDYCRLRELIKKYAPVEVRSPKSNGQSPVGVGSNSDPLVRTGTDKKEIPIISSEWGYSAVWPDFNENKQGELLARTWLTNVANGVSLSIWYDWRDDGLNPNDPEHHFGTVSNLYHDNRVPVYDPKPAYLAAKALTTFLSGYRYDSRIDVGNAEDYVLSFRKGNELRFAAWSTANVGRRALIPLNPGKYVVLGYDGRDTEQINGDQKGLSINLTTTPVYLRPSN